MRGQAAIEYVATYGWAIFFLLIVIGAILTSGILSPTYLISEECNIGPSLPCTFQLYTKGGDTKLLLNISNGFGYKIGIKKGDIKLSLPEEGLTFSNIAVAPSILESGGSATIAASLPGYEPAKGSIKKIRISVTYYSCAAEVNPNCDKNTAVHTLSGRIIGRVI